MLSARYGDLLEIAAHTDGDCHLCHEAVGQLLDGGEDDVVFWRRTLDQSQKDVGVEQYRRHR